MLKACLFTNSPDRHFILDHHPAHPEVAVAAGFSGHGYKFCSVVGEVMADLVAGGPDSPRHRVLPTAAIPGRPLGGLLLGPTNGTLDIRPPRCKKLQQALASRAVPLSTGEMDADPGRL